jgi:hypothetical protein
MHPDASEYQFETLPQQKSEGAFTLPKSQTNWNGKKRTVRSLSYCGSGLGYD